MIADAMAELVADLGKVGPDRRVLAETALHLASGLDSGEIPPYAQAPAARTLADLVQRLVNARDESLDAQIDALFTDG